jgi:hypothetical protein
MGYLWQVKSILIVYGKRCYQILNALRRNVLARYCYYNYIYII